jgi:hypothetical protein
MCGKEPDICSGPNCDVEFSEMIGVACSSRGGTSGISTPLR